MRSTNSWNLVLKTCDFERGITFFNGLHNNTWMLSQGWEAILHLRIGNVKWKVAKWGHLHICPTPTLCGQILCINYSIKKKYWMRDTLNLPICADTNSHLLPDRHSMQLQLLWESQDDRWCGWGRFVDWHSKKKLKIFFAKKCFFLFFSSFSSFSGSLRKKGRTSSTRSLHPSLLGVT